MHQLPVLAGRLSQTNEIEPCSRLAARYLSQPRSNATTSASKSGRYHTAFGTPSRVITDITPPIGTQSYARMALPSLYWSASFLHLRALLIEPINVPDDTTIHRVLEPMERPKKRTATDGQHIVCQRLRTKYNCLLGALTIREYNLRLWRLSRSRMLLLHPRSDGCFNHPRDDRKTNSQRSLAALFHCIYSRPILRASNILQGGCSVAPWTNELSVGILH